MADKMNVLYVATDNSLGGSTASLFYLIKAIEDEVSPVVLFSSEGVGVELFRQHGIECIVYPYTLLYELKRNKLSEVWRHPWRWHYIKRLRRDIGCLIHVLKILKGRRIDIVHSNTSPCDIGVRLARLLHAKHLWHVREFCDIDFHFDIYKGLPRLRKLVNQADARIAISTAIKKHWKMPDKNTWIINNAIRRKTDTCYIPAKENYVLFCSYNLSDAKGARNSIIAFAMSKMAQDGYKLKLVGNCNEDYKTSLIETAKELKVFDSLEFIPRQTDVKPFFSRAAAFIMASNFEGLGRVTAEAMFYGCPVIAHATGGTLDLVKDGETGYLYNNLEKCAQLIRKVCSEKHEAMILRAQDFAVNNLSQEVYGPKVMEVYKTVLKK